MYVYLCMLMYMYALYEYTILLYYTVCTLVVSVFPVPAGPAGAPPNLR